ncbi:hypothetical protein [Sphingomicrobium nitratireducens]|uniref:hypothetical protein n=1 Tax=Sphingomicrobium nitratireducens TaxID=2964666 RepID=UPI0022401DD8|nr:hypothetical protein [Sphingomicrobium nitratireducens]
MTLLALLLAAAVQTPTAPPPACTSEAHGAFDFWVGEWVVTPNQEGAQPVANSRIEKLYNGCAVRENWMPLGRTGGGSLNSLRDDNRWHQRWIDSAGNTVDFVGGPAGEGVMVLTGLWKNYNGPGQDRLTRMTYTRQDDGSVRQHGEISIDHGLNWSTGFDLIYRRAEEKAD